MDEIIGILFFAAVALFIPYVLPFITLSRTRKLSYRLGKIEREIAALRAGAPPPQEAPKPPPVETPAAKPEAPAQEAAEPVLSLSLRPPSSAPPKPPKPPAKPKDSLEKRLTERWAVWVGGVALALGGIFMVRWSIEAGLIGPALRCILGALLGLVLAVGGEALRQRWLAGPKLAPLAEGYIPKALSAAGIAIVFASVYAAYALYDLLPAIIAFVLLAAIALAAVALALLQGPFIALLGLVGAFAVPALVGGDGGIPELMLYLLVVSAGGIALVRFRQWWWLSWVSHIGYAFFVLLACAGPFAVGEKRWLGWFLLAYGLLVSWLATAPRISPWVQVGKPIILSLTPFAFAVWGGGVIASLLFIPAVRVVSYEMLALVPLGLAAALALAGGRREQIFAAIGAAPAIAIIALIGAWHEPSLVDFRPDVARGTVLFEMLPVPESFLGTAAAFAALFGLGAFAAMRGAKAPVVWAGLSACVPLAIAVIGYLRIGTPANEIPWALVVLALAGAYLLAARLLAAQRGDPRYEAALAVYAVAMIAALGFALTIVLRTGWLTVGLAGLAAGTAWIYGRIRLEALRYVAGIVAIVVLARLLLNPYVLDYAVGAWPIVNSLLYVYGLPSLLLFYAARELHRVRDDWATRAVEIGAIMLAYGLGCFEIRHAMNDGALAEPIYRFGEQALQSNLALAVGLILLWVHGWSGRRHHLWLGRIFAAIAIIHVVLVPLIASNPRWVAVEVGEWPVVNWLLPAYLIPGLLIAAMALSLPAESKRRKALGVLALLLGFTWVTLSVRQFFHGTALDSSFTGDGEWYAYSVAWLAGGILLLAVGIRTGLVVMRYASLALIALAVLKVFVFDMEALEGPLRALSFIGLGLSLIGLGWIYQRFVFNKPTPPSPT